MNSVAFIIPYFGQFPDWSELYFETVKSNPTIDFHFFTDTNFQLKTPANVFIHEVSFIDYVKDANQYLDFDFAPPNAYKICDLRPLFGVIHQDILKEYDF